MCETYTGGREEGSWEGVGGRPVHSEDEEEVGDEEEGDGMEENGRAREGEGEGRDTEADAEADTEEEREGRGRGRTPRRAWPRRAAVRENEGAVAIVGIDPRRQTGMMMGEPRQEGSCGAT